MTRYYIIFNFLFLCLTQPVYSMENDDVLHKLFCNHVEFAQKNNFSIEDCEIIKKFIIQGANPNWATRTPIGKEQNTLLGLTVQFRSRDLFYFLLEHNADINAPNIYGQTPLHLLSIIYDDNKKSDICVKDLVDNRADINAKTNAGLTPLHSAIYSDNIDCLHELIRFGANINEQCKEMTPLEIAVDPLRNDVKTIKELCKLKFPLINETTKNNIFHKIINLASKSFNFALTADSKESIQNIKTIITHARFDSNPKSKSVTYALWVLKYYEQSTKLEFPKDIKVRILSHLHLSDLYSYKPLCKALLLGNYKKDAFFADIYEHVANIKQILEAPNIQNETALQLMYKKFANNPNYQNNIERFLNSGKLQDDYDSFIEQFPDIVEQKKDENNLVCEIFNNYDNSDQIIHTWHAITTEK